MRRSPRFLSSSADTVDPCSASHVPGPPRDCAERAVGRCDGCHRDGWGTSSSSPRSPTREPRRAWYTTSSIGGVGHRPSCWRKAMLPHIPADATAIVPVPRSLARRVRYGIDQTAVIGAFLAAQRGVPVVRAFRAPVWWRRRAGLARSHRGPVAFTIGQPLPRGAVIVDDVLTTGSTMASLARMVPHREFHLVTATSAGTMEMRGTATSAGPGGDVPSDRSQRMREPVEHGHRAPAASAIRPPSRHVGGQPTWTPDGRSTGDRSRPR